mmetsp:Transcript_10197/g.19604  ORF Transcript_10197/g.19604 Transcript_10197/m.19604 type:complete len:201 (-) Transcript_10197:432-1034(-)
MTSSKPSPTIRPCSSSLLSIFRNAAKQMRMTFSRWTVRTVATMFLISPCVFSSVSDWSICLSILVLKVRIQTQKPARYWICSWLAPGSINPASIRTPPSRIKGSWAFSCLRVFFRALSGMRQFLDRQRLLRSTMKSFMGCSIVDCNFMDPAFVSCMLLRYHFSRDPNSLERMRQANIDIISLSAFSPMDDRTLKTRMKGW